jgi:hypothetical protein
MKWGASLVVLATTACLQEWRLEGLFACSEGDTCPGNFVCDRVFGAAQGVCCDPKKTFCPTFRRFDNICADGSNGRTYFEDDDSDGFGNPNRQTIRCARPSRFVEPGSADCDDTDPTVTPNTAELCNGRDDNCNGRIDEGLTPQQLFSRDEDGDGYPQLDAGVLACAQPPGTVPAAGRPNDCAPFEPSRHPDAGELCNGLDDDCDGRIEAGSYLDAQLVSEAARFPCVVQNAQGICAPGVWTCALGRTRVCSSVRSQEREVCDGIDTDCDGVLDNQPGCGGPVSLVGQSTLLYGGGMVPSNNTSAGTLTGNCQKRRVTAEGINNRGRLTGTRNGDTQLLWYVEAPAGTSWDLSAQNLRLNLQFTATGTGGVAPKFLWGQAGTGPNDDGVHPVVYLCGDDPNDLVRFRWRLETTSFQQNDMTFRGALTFDSSADGGTQWVLGSGSGFDTRRVRRIEVLVRFFGNAYTLDMGPQTGFVK